MTINGLSTVDMELFTTFRLRLTEHGRETFCVIDRNMRIASLMPTADATVFQCAIDWAAKRCLRAEISVGKNVITLNQFGNSSKYDIAAHFGCEFKEWIRTAPLFETCK